MERLLRIESVLLIELILLLQTLHIVHMFPQMDSSLISYDTSEEYGDSTEGTSNSQEYYKEDDIEKRNADVTKSIDKSSKIVQSLGLMKSNTTKRNVNKYYKDLEEKNEPHNPMKFKRSLKKIPIVYSDVNKFFNKRSILPMLSMKKRSISDNLITDEEIDVTDDFNLNNNDNNPDVRYKRDIGIENQAENSDENTGGIKDESRFVQPKLSSIPLLQMQMDNRTQINVTITNSTDHPLQDHIQLNDILSNIKVKRDATGDDIQSDNETGSGKEGVLDGVEDLEVAESSVVFKPLFRYSSQISQRRKVSINDYY